jgi:putative addiction module killer protein
MNTILRTAAFASWLQALPDRKAKAIIARRITGAEQGNFGDCEPAGEGVSEMRIHYGPGYRIYLIRTAVTVYLLLGGGDKSTQSKDIKRAKALARELRS